LNPKFPIAFFKRVGKYMFALTSTGHIFYIRSDLTRFKARKIEIPASISEAKDASDSLFVRFDNGQIAVLHQNEFDFLALPCVSQFEVDHEGERIYVCLENAEWQLWSVKPLHFLGRVSVCGQRALCSPIPSICTFFSGNKIVVSYFLEVFQHEELPVEKVQLAKFDGLGQILFFSSGNELYHAGFATVSSIHSRALSAPITSRALLLPFREMLFSIPLPHGIRGKFSVFGESSLAVASLTGLCVVTFDRKLSQAISDGTAHTQFIKNASLLTDGEIPNWIIRNGLSVRGMSWSGTNLVVLCFRKLHRIDVISFSKSDNNNILYSIPLTAKPLSLAVSGSRLLIAYGDQLSFHSLDNAGKLVSTNSLGEITAQRVVFLNSETIAVHTPDRRLLLISRSKVQHIFDDVDGFQLTGSTAWPMLVFGHSWRILGANNAELFLGDGMLRGLFLGVDGFSLFSVAPHRLVDFVHLVVVQSVVGDSLASAVSILAQSPDDRKLQILTDVGIAIPDPNFRRFMSLLDRFPPLQDRVLYAVFQARELQIDKREFWNLALLRGWYDTASVLARDVDATACADLIIKSGFSLIVVRNTLSAHPSLFESSTSIAGGNAGWWRLEEELQACLRLKLFRNDFLFLAELLPIFQDGIKRFLLRSRRERETGRDATFASTVAAMRRCSRQQLIALAAVFEDTLAFELLFGASYCLNNFAKCIECVERQQRMAITIDADVLIAIGYTTK
jgi:hypothetical protein